MVSHTPSNWNASLSTEKGFEVELSLFPLPTRQNLFLIQGRICLEQKQILIIDRYIDATLQGCWLNIDIDILIVLGIASVYMTINYSTYGVFFPDNPASRHSWKWFVL